MTVQLPYGHTGLSCPIGDNTTVLRVKTEQGRPPQDGLSLVRQAMSAPAGGKTLCSLAKGRSTCTIIISDHTRPVPSRDILPPMLEELRAGNPDIRITLLVATGCHRGTTEDELRRKLGDEIFDRERIVVHDCDRNNIPVGKLPSGAELLADRLAVETDLLVAEGFIEPHFFAGFSGGRKSVLPGICARKTVLGNHCSRFIDSDFARAGILEGNPIHKDMIAAAQMLHLAYIVNVVIDEEKNTVAAFAGDPVQAHQQGCEFLGERCRICAEPADIVITTNGGAPLDQNIYQCVKGITTAEGAVRRGGAIILCAECADGVGGETFYHDLKDCTDAAALYDRIMATPADKTEPDQWQSQILARVMRDHPIFMVTRPQLRQTVEEMKMTYAATVEEALAAAEKAVGKPERIYVIPDGVSVIVQSSPQ